MKKKILAMAVILSFVACNKNKLSQNNPQPAVDKSNTESNTSTAVPLAPGAPKLVYVTYDDPTSGGTGLNYVVNLDAAGTVITSTPIALPPLHRVTGGIARRKVGAVYEYFVTTCTAVATSETVYESQIDPTTGALLSGTISLCSTVNTLTDFKNYLRENGLSTFYYFRKGGDIYRGTVPGCPALSTTVGPLIPFGGSISFGTGNITGPVYANRHPNSPTNQGDMFKSTATILGLWSAVPTASNLYTSFISPGMAEHCLTVDNATASTLYLIYNGQYVVGGVAKHCILAKGPASGTSFPSVIVTDFPRGPFGAPRYAYITDIEAL